LPQTGGAVSVDEDSLLIHVGVEVQTEVNDLLADELQQQSLDSKNLGLLLRRRIVIEPV
jgi:hypothetical protein